MTKLGSWYSFNLVSNNIFRIYSVQARSCPGAIAKRGQYRLDQHITRAGLLRLVSGYCLQGPGTSMS